MPALTSEVTVLVANGDLTTIDKVCLYLKEDKLAVYDVISGLITSSSKWVTNQIGRQFTASTEITETRDGDGTTRLLLRQAPALSAISVTVDGTVIPARPAVTGEGWVLNTTEWAIDLVGYEFTKGIQNVVIVYNVGGDVPADLEQAVIEHVALRYQNRGSIGLAQAASAGETAIYSGTGGSTFAYIQGVIDSYRTLVIG